MKKIIKINKFKDSFFKINNSEFCSINLNKHPNIQKILIIKWGGMGDLIQASAVINDVLKRQR